MRHHNHLLTAIALTILSFHPSFAEESLEALTSRVLDIAARQYSLMDGYLPEGRCPRTTDRDGKMVTSGIDWWCSGFYPGSLWYLYENTGNESIRVLAEKHTLKLEPVLRMHTDHDIGFIIDCSFGNALRITGDKSSYEDVLLKAADKLAARFNPVTGVIRSWDGEWTKRWDYPVIIDNMMNLELLMDAYRINGKEELKTAATTHANTTMRNHFRSDYSCWHLVDYNSTDGSITGKQTHQGYSDDSTWARGEAWALYGFIMMYRKTGDEQYYLCADNIAKLLLRTLPADGVPYWDFECNDYRDASAAAIMASAFVQMYEVSGRSEYFDMACRQIRTLSSDEYLAEAGSNGGFLLKHCVGNLPGKSEIDAPLTYADYYFLEALTRLRKATSHPRLFIDDSQFADLKRQVLDGSNPALGAIHRQIMSEADNFPSDSVVWKLDDSGKRILSQSRKALRRLVYSAYAYRFSGEAGYLEYALKTLDEVCSMQDWNGWHFLDVAEMAAGVGIAYDWLYHDLNEEMRHHIESVLYDKALMEASDFSKAWFYDRHHNWNQVCNGGLVIAAAATRETSGVLAGNIIRNAVKCSHKEIRKIYDPDGCYAEGPSYWTYGNEYQAMMNDCFDSVIGDDFGIGSIKGMDRTADYIVNCYGAAHKMFNYSDNSARETPSMPVWYFAYRYGKPWLLGNELEFLDRGTYFDGNCSVLPIMAAYAARIDAKDIRRPDAGVYLSGGDNPIAIIRGDFSGSDTDWYLGVKAGKASNNHGHADAGSFVFDRDGVRWSSDPGGASYTKSENSLKAKGGDFWKMDQNSLRWTVFPLSNLWHSTITVDGAIHNVEGKATITEAFRDKRGAIVTADLGALFPEKLEKAVRTFKVDSERTLTVTDEIKARKSAEITFTLATEARPEILDNGVKLYLEGHTAFLSASGVKATYSCDRNPEAEERGLYFVRIRYSVRPGRTYSVCVSLQ
ncbi:MAG: heparinase II/III family protein [Bacteroidales bacterium]|nr:heparinase II/III family protein [Bacteroidales bacterium]